MNLLMHLTNLIGQLNGRVAFWPSGGHAERLVLSSSKGLRCVVEFKIEFLTAHVPLADAPWRVPTVRKRQATWGCRRDEARLRPPPNLESGETFLPDFPE